MSDIEKLAEDTCAIIESDGAIVFQQKEHLRHFAEAYAKQQQCKASLQQQEPVALADEPFVCTISIQMIKELESKSGNKFPYHLWPNKLYTTPPDQSEQQQQEQEPVAKCIEVEYKVDSFSNGTRIFIEILPHAKLNNGDKLFTTPPDQSKLIESQASEIAELKSDRAHWRREAVKWAGELTPLQSYINELREALVLYRGVLITANKFGKVSVANELLKIEQALASTPSQSLARVIDETIERCICELDGWGYDFASEKIRTLKAGQ